MGTTRHLQARAVATRDSLLIAASEQFAEAGYHGTSLREVLLNSGLTKGALYFHFSGKQALADAVIAEMLTVKQRMVDEVESWALDPLRTLVAEVNGIADLMVNDPIVRGGTRLLNDPTIPNAQAVESHDYAETATRVQLVAAASAGLLRPSVDITVIARSLFIMVAGHNLVCERTRSLGELPGRVDAMWRAMLPLIATDEWLAGWRERGL